MQCSAIEEQVDGDDEIPCYSLGISTCSAGVLCNVCECCCCRNAGIYPYWFLCTAKCKGIEGRLRWLNAQAEAVVRTEVKLQDVVCSTSLQSPVFRSEKVEVQLFLSSIYVDHKLVAFFKYDL